MTLSDPSTLSKSDAHVDLILNFIETRPPYPHKHLKATFLKTPLGRMLAIADHQALFILEFIDSLTLTKKMAQLIMREKSSISFGETPPLKSIQQELAAYFLSELKAFTTPLSPLGTPFQQQIWTLLRQIPFGQTWSYAKLAKSLGKPTAFRAAANANGANPLPIIIPCHRVINTNGNLGGYSGGFKRKEWLLAHEGVI